jgi:hypothetical protein
VLPKLPPEGAPRLRPPAAYASQPDATNPCVPLLTNGRWADAAGRIFTDSGKASYRLGEVKSRDISLTYLGNFLIIKRGRSENAGSASENIVNLRGIARSENDVELQFKCHHWVYTASSPGAATDLVKACVTLGMILYQGPPAFTVSEGNGKLSLESLHLFEIPSDQWIVSNNLPVGWEMCFCKTARHQAPYYINHSTQETHWTLPPDVLEMVTILWCLCRRLSCNPLACK